MEVCVRTGHDYLYHLKIHPLGPALILISKDVLLKASEQDFESSEWSLSGYIHLWYTVSGKPVPLKNQQKAQYTGVKWNKSPNCKKM